MSGNIELDKVYDPGVVEPAILELWERNGCFRAVPDERPPDRRYVIMIPLPNVTGALHLGHAINNTLQDVMIRLHRMKGKNTLWQPGTDHAGIATQAVVERRIHEEEGLSRHDLGRDKLVERIWAWKDQYQARIITQLKQIGASCDWQRTRFTLDEVCSKAVRHAFFRWFKDGLIYRGKRLVNWDTQLQTAVADDEVYHETVQGHFWHIKYPVIDAKPGEPEFVVIATTRPETMLGDTAVAVHPDPQGELARREATLQSELATATGREKREIQQRLDAIAERRESHLPTLLKLRDMAGDGRKVLLPLVDRPIPLIHDEWADPEKGTGCVKITPAHDANDYDVGLRHGLPMVNVLTADGKVAQIIEPDGRVNPNNDRYAGLTFAGQGRQKVVAELEAAGLLDHVEDHEMDVGHSDRSKTPIEPYLSDQWFVRMSDVPGGITLGDGSKSSGLNQAAMDAVLDGRVKVFPERYAKTYLDWLGEKRDWCISRQLWWGHRIPVWMLTLDIGGVVDADYETRTQRIIEEARAALDAYFRAACVNSDDYVLRVEEASRIRLCARDKAVDAASALEAFCKSYVFQKVTPDEPISAVLPKVPRFESATNAADAVFRRILSIERDTDVLDTWFSSALWPFSTLGWPDPNPDLDFYYPGSVLITSRDIITLWVARMVLSGLYFLGDIPFHHTYIHTKILDGRGESMSKSKGNGVDPLDIVDIYGADALRYTMAEIATELQDVRLPVDYRCPHCHGLTPQTAVVPAHKRPSDVTRIQCQPCGKPFATQWASDPVKNELQVARETSDRFETGRNLCNKLWNAARFAFMHLEGTTCEPIDVAAASPEDRWILAELSRVAKRANELMARYQFSPTVKLLREFFWDSLCDWYVELTKPRLAPDAPADRRGSEARQVLAFCLDQTLRLFHPFIPFVTERLWQQLNAIVPRRGLPGVAGPDMSDLLATAGYPPEGGWPGLDDPAIVAVFGDIQSATRGVRELRNRCKVAPKTKVDVTVKAPRDHLQALQRHAHIVREMAGIGDLRLEPDALRPPNAATTILGGLRIMVHDISDDQAERKRIETECAGVDKQIAAKQTKLANEKFVANAKPEVVEAERQRLAALEAQRRSLHQALEELS